MKEFNELLSAGKARVTKEMSKKGVGPNLLKELRALGLGSESESAIAEKIKKGQECISKTSTEAEAADKVDEIASGEVRVHLLLQMLPLVVRVRLLLQMLPLVVEQIIIKHVKKHVEESVDTKGKNNKNSYYYFFFKLSVHC